MVDTTCAVSEQPPSQATQHPIGLYEAFLFWLKLGFISFGGPAGQISIMHQELVALCLPRGLSDTTGG